jgi:hypothetical protein
MRCTNCGFMTEPNSATCVHCGALVDPAQLVGPVQPSYDQPAPSYDPNPPGYEQPAYSQPPPYDPGAYPYDYAAAQSVTQPVSPGYPAGAYQYPAPYPGSPVVLPPATVPPETPPTRRRLNPVWPIGGVVLLLTAVLIGTQLPLLRHGTGRAAASASPAAGSGPGGAGTPVPTGAPATTNGGGNSGDAAAEAGSVNALLGLTSGSRSKLGKALNDLDNCPGTSQLRSDKNLIDQVATERTDQLNRARALDLHALNSGDAVKSALVEALSDSVQADHDYSAWATDEINGNCRTTPNRTHGDMVSGEADKAKQRFVILWNPIAVQYGLPTRVETDV